MGRQGRADAGPVAIHQVEHPRGQTRIMAELGKDHRIQRAFFRRLQHTGAARQNRRNGLQRDLVDVVAMGLEQLLPMARTPDQRQQHDHHGAGTPDRGPDHDRRQKAAGIGGAQSDNSTLQSGAAYLFTRSGATWSQRAYLKASNTASHIDFSQAIALSADGNTLAIASRSEATSATDPNTVQTGTGGSVYLY